MLQLSFSAAKESFFDRKSVLSQMTVKERQVLSRMGAFVRTRARTSIRKRKATSAPGQAPSSHTGHLRNKIFFAWDPATRSVVIGPTPLSMQPITPRLLEEGGAISLNQQQQHPGAPWRTVLSQRSRRAGEAQRIARVRIAPRPYMGPALRAELPRLPALFSS